MKLKQQISGRRNFIRTTAGLLAGFGLLPKFAESKIFSPPDNINIIGPLPGYSTEIGTFVSMLNWMRYSVAGAVKGLTQQELDFLVDEKSNTIGALLSHLAATEVIYQDLTFHNLKDFSYENKKKWNVAMNLGDEGRKQIKGNKLDYYLKIYRRFVKSPWPNLKRETISGWQKLIHLSLATSLPIIIANGSMFASMKPTTGARSL